MGLRFTVLASGSSGNASLIEWNGFGVLLDTGLGPRQLAKRLAAVGASVQSVQAVLLTHTHGDHWSDRTFAHLGKHGVAVYCHPNQQESLRRYSPGFAALEAAGAVHAYEADVEVEFCPGLSCTPLRVRHDSGATFGFRFEAAVDLFGQPSALGYAADLGCWDAELARALSDVDLLALEFNHDVAMEYGSGRDPRLVARVLGDDGHLSNEQAAAMLREVLRLSRPGRLRHLVQLRLSRDCNRPSLAQAAARTALADLPTPVEVVTARQDEPCATIHLNGANGGGRLWTRPRGRTTSRQPSSAQQWLPGMD
jgi:phosphoribosyl 1,2-cyclic phosphodiesterase